MATEKRKTRYLPLDFLGSGKLPLPSFETSVTRSDPKVGTLPAGESLFVPFRSGDAFSVSYAYEGDDISAPDQDFLRLDLGYLRRILLEIYSSEEYESIESFHVERIRKPTAGYKSSANHPHPDPGEDSLRTASVRLSDLRLANAIGTTALEREVNDAIRGLEIPVTTERILRWKWETLEVRPPAVRRPGESPSHGSGEEMEVERSRLIAVSFAASAICLLLDLKARGLPEANHDDLRRWVVKLRGVIEKFTASLDKTAKELEKLVSARGGGRPIEGVKDYAALHLYQMGRDRKEIAGWLGIKPFDEKTGKGSRAWATKVKQHLARGVEVEREKLPLAAELFARHNEDAVRHKAIEAYRKYVEEKVRLGAGYIAPVDVSDNPAAAILGDPADETRRAYVQLGACIELGLDPLPSVSRDK
jgi:hypothetical protein